MSQDPSLEEDRSSAQDEQVNVRATGDTSSVALVSSVGDVGRGILSNFVPNLARFPFGVAGWSIGSKKGSGPPSRADAGDNRGPVRVIDGTNVMPEAVSVNIEQGADKDKDKVGESTPNQLKDTQDQHVEKGDEEQSGSGKPQEDDGIDVSGQPHNTPKIHPEKSKAQRRPPSFDESPIPVDYGEDSPRSIFGETEGRSGEDQDGKGKPNSLDLEQATLIPNQVSAVTVSGDDNNPRGTTSPELSAPDSSSKSKKKPRAVEAEEARIAVQFAAQVEIANREEVENVRDWSSMLSWVYDVYDSLTDSQKYQIDIKTVAKFLALRHDEKIKVANGPSTVVKVLSRFRDNGWLSDEIIDLCCRAIQAHSPRHFALLDSLVWCLQPEYRHEPVEDRVKKGLGVGLLISVMNIGDIHWTVAALDFHKNKKVLFEPLQDRIAYRELNKICDEYFRPHLRGIWPNLDEEKFETFKQRDGSNCGLYVVDFVYHYVTDTLKDFRPRPTVDAENAMIQFTRLKFLSIIFQQSKVASANDEITSVFETFSVGDPQTTQAKKKKRRRRPKGNRSDDGTQSVFSFDDGNHSTGPVYSDDEADHPTTPRLQRRIDVSSEDESATPLVTEMTSSQSNQDFQGGNSNKDALGGKSDDDLLLSRITPHSPPSPPSAPPSSSSYSPSSSHISTHGSPSNSDQSVIASPITHNTVQPIPRLDGSPVMSLASLRNELVSFVYKYRHAGVTPATVLAYFANHLNVHNKAAFIKMFEDLTERVGDSYVLVAPYQPNDEEQVHQDRRKVKKQVRENKKRKRVQARESRKRKRQKVAGDAEDEVEHSEAQDDSIDRQDNVAPNEVDALVNNDDSSDGTESDTQGRERRQLRDNVMQLLEGAKAGLSRVTIHRKIRSVDNVPLRIIDRVLEEVGQESNRRWFLKRKKRPALTNKTDSNEGGSDNEANEGGSDNEASWSPTKRKRLKKKTALEIEAEQLPPGTAVISRFLDLRYKADGTPQYQVQWEVDASNTRPESEWIDDSAFIDKTTYKDPLDHLFKWKKSGLAKSTYFRKNPGAKQYLDLQQTAGADGDGLCAFKAVGWALHALTGRQVVTKELIEKFQQAGVKRNPHIDEPKCGAKWPEVLSFIRQLCSKKVGYNIKLDFNQLTRNLSQGGAGLAALKKAKLGSGLYLVAGNNTEQNAGHCVVVEVESGSVQVHEEDISGGVENLDWLHQVSYIRRIKLKDTDEIQLRKLYGKLYENVISI